MSIHQAMFAGSSALTNYGNAMTVIGNNLANANTTAFKGSRTTFEDVLIQTVGISGTRSSTQMGTGVGVSAIDQLMQQGSFNGTQNVTDMAIDGIGFFKVRDPNAFADQGGGGGNATSGSDIFYTRAGDYKQDVNGMLVTNAGLVLQGWAVDENGLRTGQTTDIDLSSLQTSSPSATTSVNVGLNLNSQAAIIDSATAYDPNDPTTYNFASSVRVYDSLGQGHNVEVHLRKTDSNTWEWHAAVNSDELATGAGTDTLTAVDQITGNVADAAGTYTAGTLTFDTNGRLLTEGSTPITFDFTGSTATDGTATSQAMTQQILFDFGDAVGTDGDSTNDYTVDSTTLSWTASAVTENDQTDANGDIILDNTGTAGSIQLSSDFATLKLSQNGYSTGFLETLSIAEDGKIYGAYTNGETKALYQISLVDFDNQQALEQVGANLFSETALSGLPREGEPGSGRLGDIVSYALEASNVDMSSEFVTMITTQRAFQANSRLVTVTDGMLEELIALKR
ncbi:flagellar hook protein FlgE [Magnetofaba australis]|uniref:Flagellar hook protein FlgE n=1 Tax=Magnetofaba australis IT-1 TaxID=1434232 RepID=A0A1Y2K0P8_9PROT|nr:flagellar hook protein FlgE [Magnetofaba australis]OSM00374.1 putative flagellar hook protein FlgE [Magnetofaba australis IT-1]